MTATGLFDKIGELFSEIWNCGLFTTDSLEGWVCIFLLLYILSRLGRKALEFAGWCVGLMFLAQILYHLGRTGFGDSFPWFRDIFNYNLMGNFNAVVTNDLIHGIIESLDKFIETVMNAFYNLFASGNITDMARRAVTFDI